MFNILLWSCTLLLAGVSQAWMLSSGLPPEIAVRGQCVGWLGLTDLRALTVLNLGGTHFHAHDDYALWVCHLCPLLASMTCLQKLVLAHCSIPPGRLRFLLPQLSPSLRDLSISR